MYSRSMQHRYYPTPFRCMPASSNSSAAAAASAAARHHRSAPQLPPRRPPSTQPLTAKTAGPLPIRAPSHRAAPLELCRRTRDSRDEVFDAVVAANAFDTKERADAHRSARADRVRIAVERYGRHGTYRQARGLPTDDATWWQPAHAALPRRDAPMLVASSSAPILAHRAWRSTPPSQSQGSSSSSCASTTCSCASTTAAVNNVLQQREPSQGQPCPPPPPPTTSVSWVSSRHPVSPRQANSATERWHVPEASATTANAFDPRHSARLKVTPRDSDAHVHAHACRRDETAERMSSFRRNLVEVRARLWPHLAKFAALQDERLRRTTNGSSPLTRKRRS